MAVTGTPIINATLPPATWTSNTVGTTLHVTTTGSTAGPIYGTSTNTVYPDKTYEEYMEEQSSLNAFDRAIAQEVRTKFMALKRSRSVSDAYKLAQARGLVREAEQLVRAAYAASTYCREKHGNEPRNYIGIEGMYVGGLDSLVEQMFGVRSYPFTR